MYVLRSFPFLYLSLNCIKNNWKLTSFVLLQVRGGKQRAELLVLVGGRRWEDGCIAHCKGFSVPHINISNDLAAFHSHVCVCVCVRLRACVCVNALQAHWTWPSKWKCSYTEKEKKEEAPPVLQCCQKVSVGVPTDTPPLHLSQSPSYVPFPLPFSLLLNPVVIVWVLNRQPNVQLLAFRWEWLPGVIQWMSPTPLAV